MGYWMNLGQIQKINAKKFPKTVALRDAERAFTYPQMNSRINKLANSLTSLGLQKGDKVAVLLENCIEICELFMATAKAGIIIVPINFRLVSSEVEYIVNNSDAKAMVVHDRFADVVAPIRSDLDNIDPQNYVIVGRPQDGYQPYEKFIEASPDSEPQTEVAPRDTWILIYTSGTTGKPKGVIRSHESHIAYYLHNAVDFGFNEHDVCLNVMPLCHINSIFFTFTFLYIGGSAYIHPALNFKPDEILKIIEKEKITFISLIPTHYNLILNAPEGAKKRDVSSIRKLLCSSAPGRKSMKQAVMKFFPGVKLYEAYGSTEAGMVTILKPEYQMSKLGSIGFECIGTDFIKILDMDGKEVPVGEIGELYARGPMLFDEYYKLPEQTAESFDGGFFSAGDMARQDEDGFYYLVDRKKNMIITGGENVYPSEVEEIVGNIEGVFECAVIGLPDEKWGEKVSAVIIRKPGFDDSNLSEQDIVQACKGKMAGYKCPKQVIFIGQKDMPRTGTGKILHRILREQFG
ncbi:MAG: AMP-binding protein [Desulfobacterales bacterium]|nr:AMP-binding protein [Desulfobacterales bacterium]